jgi:hypothetical protein
MGPTPVNAEAVFSPRHVSSSHVEVVTDAADPISRIASSKIWLWKKKGTRLVSSPTGTYGNAVADPAAGMRHRPPNQLLPLYRADGAE